MILDNCDKIEELRVSLFCHLLVIPVVMNQDFRHLFRPEVCRGIKTLELFASHYYYHTNQRTILDYTLVQKNFG